MKYSCDVCGKTEEWGPSWSRYSSFLLDENCPNDVPRVCSVECREIAERKIKDKTWQLPVVKTNGYQVKLVKPKKGYGK